MTHKDTSSHVSIYEFESVKSELDIVRSQLTTTKSKISVIESDRDALKQLLASFKHTVDWISRQFEVTYSASLEVVDNRVREMNRKIDSMQEMVGDTIVFSNKTHYAEEVNRLKN